MTALHEPAAARCPVCSSRNAAALRDYRGTHETFRQLELIECGHCELVFAWPPPAENHLAAYNSSYYDSAHGGMSSDEFAAAFHSGMARVRLHHLETYRESHQPHAIESVLEIGPGHGYFGAHLLGRYPQIDYHAVESDRSCHAALQRRGMTVHSSLEELPQQTPSFDVLVISHMLEHTHDPKGLLQQALSRLRAGAVVFVEVPCRDYEHKRSDEPHLVFFDKPSLGLLLKRLGLTSVELSYHGREIADLKRDRMLTRRLAARIKSFLLRRRIRVLFPVSSRGMEYIADKTERAAVRLFEGHLTRQEPAWWLRAAGRKAR